MLAATKEARTMKLHIEDLHCEACARRVTRAIQGEDPAATVTIDVPAKLADVATSTPLDQLLARLADAGYPAEVRG